MTYDDRVAACVAIIRINFPDDSERLQEVADIITSAETKFNKKVSDRDATIARLRKFLNTLEWNLSCTASFCNWCGYDKSYGHNRYCELAKEIGDKDADSIRPK